MATEATSQHTAGDENLKRLRSRKVYIELRIPRIKAEITAIAGRKKNLKEAGNETSKEAVEEMIYNNQHLVSLRKELQALELERKTVFKDLRELRQQDTEKEMPAASD